jgi:GNAT superfamily N-acetyltransferase
MTGARSTWMISAAPPGFPWETSIGSRTLPRWWFSIESELDEYAASGRSLGAEMTVARDVLIENEFGYCRYDIDEIEGACIYNLYVYRGHRRQGKAREILCAAIKAIRSHGYEYCIGIEAIPKENSISQQALVDFYKSLELCVMNSANPIDDTSSRF